MLKNMKKFCDGSLCINSVIPKDNWQKNPNRNNNNSSSVSCRESNGGTNGCHMNPCEKEFSENDNKELSEILNDDVHPMEEAQKLAATTTTTTMTAESNSNQSSTNNSTDNLSLLSDNGIVDELVVLPDTLSEDELSINSDDCVYAYRGADCEMPENRNSLPDDETDYLEMDFEPDPASEVDSSVNECSNISFNEFYNVQNNKDGFQRMLNINLSKIQFDNDQKTACNRVDHQPMVMQGFSQASQAKEVCVQSSSTNFQLRGSSKHNSNHYESEEFKRTNCDSSDNPSSSCQKITGAKPKKILPNDNKIPNKSVQTMKLLTNKKETVNDNLKSILTETGDCVVDGSMHNTQNHPLSRNDEICMDCLEKEFLYRSFGKIIQSNFECRKCFFKLNDIIEQNQNQSSKTCFPDMRSSVMPSTFISVQANSPTTTSKEEDRIGISHFDSDQSKRGRHQRQFAECEQRIRGEMAQQQQRAAPNNKESVSFSSINVDEKTIAQALEKLGVSFDRELIRKHFDAMMNKCTFKDVPELIMYMSRRNCDYKRITEVIRLASKDELEVKFLPSTTATTTRTNENEPDTDSIVQVNCRDIINTWTPKSNLERLKKFDQRFVQMNVLGKVINIIRLAKQRTVQLQSATIEFISIPQYYRSGHIKISKK